MSFVTQLEDGLWLTEHVVSDPERLREEGRCGSRPAPYAIRTVWDVDVQYGEIVATPRRVDRMDRATRSGHTSPVRKSQVVDGHVEDLERKLVLEHGADREDIHIEYEGPLP